MNIFKTAWTSFASSLSSEDHNLINPLLAKSPKKITNVVDALNVCFRFVPGSSKQSNVPDKNGALALLRACKKLDSPSLNYSLAQAVINMNYKAALFLLEEGADVNSRTEDGDLVIVAAIENMYIEMKFSKKSPLKRRSNMIFDLLVRSGAKIERCFKFLRAAILLGRDDLVEIQLKKGAYVMESDYRNAVDVCPKIFYSLIQHQRIGKVHSDELLLQACEKGKFEAAKILLQHGAKPAERCYEQVFLRGDLAMVKLLVEYGGDEKQDLIGKFDPYIKHNDFEKNKDCPLILYLYEMGADLTPLNLSNLELWLSPDSASRLSPVLQRRLKECLVKKVEKIVKNTSLLQRGKLILYSQRKEIGARSKVASYTLPSMEERTEIIVPEDKVPAAVRLINISLGYLPADFPSWKERAELILFQAQHMGKVDAKILNFRLRKEDLPDLFSFCLQEKELLDKSGIFAQVKEIGNEVLLAEEQILYHDHFVGRK